MAYLKEFLPHVLTYVSTCSESVAITVLRDICIEFCSETQVWQDTLDPISSVVGENKYELSPPIDATIHSVVSAWYKDMPVEVINSDSGVVRPEFYNDKFSNARNDLGDPTALLVDINNKQMTLYPTPKNSDAFALTVRAVLRPSRTAMKVPDFLLHDYEYAITQGAIARIARMPGNDFSDLNTAAMAAGVYMNAKGAAKVRSNKTFARSQVSVKMRPLA